MGDEENTQDDLELVPVEVTTTTETAEFDEGGRCTKRVTTVERWQSA